MEAPGTALIISIELAREEWKLGLTDGVRKSPWVVAVTPLSHAELDKAIADAKRKFKLPETAKIYSCYEAGGEGFSVHRWLLAKMIVNIVVDPASIKVTRKQKNAKTDRLDAVALAELLARLIFGEPKALKAIKVPTPEEEDARNTARELDELTRQRSELITRTKSLLFAVGVAADPAKAVVTGRRKVEELRTPVGAPLGVELAERMRRLAAQYALIQQQIKTIESKRTEGLREWLVAQQTSTAAPAAGAPAASQGPVELGALVAKVEGLGATPAKTRRYVVRTQERAAAYVATEAPPPKARKQRERKTTTPAPAVVSPPPTPRSWSDYQHRMYRMVFLLMGLCGIGPTSAWLFVTEFYGWRQFKNRRQVGGAAGLQPVPFGSGNTFHDQGISRAGNWRIRAMAVQIAWGWVRLQPDSELTQWYLKKCGDGGKLQKKKAIVGLARRLLIALWRYVEKGELPKGARLKPLIALQ